MKKNIEKKLSKFSVPLGLVDYINPIFYGITTFTIIKNMNNVMSLPSYIFFIVGAVISLIFGLTIPTVKVLVGTGKIKFKMPVNFVFFVNSAKLFHFSYQRYLENRIRETFSLIGTPIRFIIREKNDK